MFKTTVYLTPELKAGVERVAARRQVSEAAVIREAITAHVQEEPRPRPRPGLFSYGKIDTSRIDDYLVGFGEL